VTSEPPPEVFDEDFAKAIVGKYILVGVTHLDYDGKELRHEQFHGVIVRASRREGIVISLRGTREGETWNMPPDTRGISQAKPGTYRLRQTGETIENPDLVITWTARDTKEPTKH
jgi:hypothetical protein